MLDKQTHLYTPAPLALRFLTALTKHLPPVRGSGSIGLYVVRPLWTRNHHGSYVLPTWRGVKMLVNPEDCIGGILAFVPQLFDRWEREALTKILPQDGTFVDVGANIGAYSLWAAQHCAPGAKIISIEADSENYDSLKRNIALNGFSQITPIHAGISDHHDELTFYKNTTGNRGAHNFCERGVPSGKVQCLPLSDALEQQKLNKVDVLKLDIEGFEFKVLSKFFLDFPANSAMRPTFLLVEIEGGPQTNSEKASLRQMVLDNGYIIIHDEMNTLFQRASA
jgi:FkbM family methyltransferase